MSFEKVVKIQKVAQKNHETICLYRNEAGTRCGKRAIASHSLQKRGPLHVIAEDGHVLKFGPDKGDLLKHRQQTVFRQGIKKKASVFGGFCQEHDNAMFLEIENRIEKTTPRIVALFCYRALCMELFKKQHALELFKVLQNEILESDEAYERVNWRLEGTQKAISDLDRNKLNLEHAIYNSDFSRLHFSWVEFENPLPFAYTGGFAPEVSFSGKNCLSGKPLQYSWDCVSAFCGSAGGKNLFLMGGINTEKRHLFPDFFKSFERHSSELHSAYILNLGLTHLENTFFKPSWYEGLSQLEKNYIANKKTEAMFHRPPQYALIPIPKINTGTAIDSGFNYPIP